jgi:hypothetical protein
MTSITPPPQWPSLLKNLGAWHGSFTQFSPQGKLKSDTPTCVSLEGLNDNKTIRQTVQRFSATTGEVAQSQTFEYSTLGKGILFFEDGAFSQGSIQRSPVAEFGAELGFIQGDRRLRLVELFDQEGYLASFSLIREALTPKAIPPQPDLTLEQLLGTWQGDAVTLYPSFQPGDRITTHLHLEHQGDRLQQHLTTPQIDLTSTATIEPTRLLFDQGSVPMQVLLLPNGASATTPLSIPKGHPFFLEAGWLITPTLRQRMIRSYDANGTWQSLTLVTEQRISSI